MARDIDDTPNGSGSVVSNVSRRRLLTATGAGAGLAAFGGTGSAVGQAEGGDGQGNDGRGDSEVDEPEGFRAEILQSPVPFPDEVAATFSLSFTDDETEGDGTDATDHDDGQNPIGAHVHLDDESTMIVAEATWEPDGTSGWHRHPGVAFVSVIEGELELAWDREGEPRTYTAGEGFFDPGVPHRANNLSSEESARALVVFFGIPDGAAATEWVEPRDG